MIYIRFFFYKNIDKGIKIDYNVLGYFFLFMFVCLGVVGYFFVLDIWGIVYRCCVWLWGMLSLVKCDMLNDIV